MRVFLTGRTGFVGRHVAEQLRAKGHEEVGMMDRPNAMLHLAWEGLPDYENPEHFENVPWQLEWVSMLAGLGATNVVVAGTIWETCPNPPPYVQAKLELYKRLQGLPIILKWVRAPYLYGAGQRKECLLPALRRAIAAGDKEFRIAAVELPFMDVSDYAARLVDSLEDDRNQVTNLPGVVMRVADFCRAQVPESAGINLIEDYPLKPWES